MQFLSFSNPKKLRDIVGAVLRRGGMSVFTRLEQLYSRVKAECWTLKEFQSSTEHAELKGTHQDH